jgi:hypothetical protein
VGGNRRLQIAGSQTNAVVDAEYIEDRTAGRAFIDVGRYCKLRAARKLLRYHLPRAFSEGRSVQYGRVVTDTASWRLSSSVQREGESTGKRPKDHSSFLVTRHFVRLSDSSPEVRHASYFAYSKPHKLGDRV